MELAGHRCVGFCEYDKYAVASYTSMHLVTESQRDDLLKMDLKQRQKEIMREEYRNGEWYANDIRTVEAGSLPHADCWCFGFPCQDISIAGKQLGFSGRRSSLFFAVTGLIKDLEEENRPGVLFIENVKNLLSVNRGLDFAKLLIELDEIGYDAEWCLLNSKDFGVPQNRERVFIIGHLRGRSGRKVFPLGESYPISETGRKSRSLQSEHICSTLTGNYRKGVHNQGETYVLKKVYEHQTPISMTRKAYKETDIANTLTAGTPDKRRGNYSPVTGVICLNVSDKNGKERPQQDRVYSTEGVMTSLNAQLGGRHNIETKTRIRKLTPRECFRLQGWTDEYFDRAAMINSDSQLYKQAGNGVTVSVIQAIAERL